MDSGTDKEERKIRKGNRMENRKYKNTVMDVYLFSYDLEL